MRRKRAITVAIFLCLISIFVFAKNMNLTRSSFTVKSNANVGMTVANFELEYKLLDSNNTEVTTLNLNEDYILEIYNPTGLPCNLYMTTEGSTYNTFSKYVKVIVEEYEDNSTFCESSSGSSVFLTRQRTVLEAKNAWQKKTSEPLKFKVKLDTTYITEHSSDICNKITDYEFDLKLKLYSYTL